MKIILISGKAESGKDTTAALMRDELKKDGNSVLITHYADLLKFICKGYFLWDGAKNESGRILLQHFGSKIRKKNPDFWVDFVMTMMEYSENLYDYVIIPDCRFPNEIEKPRQSGYETIHIEIRRDGYNSRLTEEQKAHESETSLDDYSADYYIFNEGTMGDLNDKVRTFVREVLYVNKES